MELRPTAAGDLETILGWVENNQEMVMWSGLTFTWPLEYGQLARYLDNPNRTYWSAVDTAAKPRSTEAGGVRGPFSDRLAVVGVE